MDCKAGLRIRIQLIRIQILSTQISSGILYFDLTFKNLVGYQLKIENETKNLTLHLLNQLLKVRIGSGSV